jgi:hypothetical protein
MPTDSRRSKTCSPPYVAVPPGIRAGAAARAGAGAPSDPQDRIPPSPGAMLEELVPLVGVIPVAGPPAILLAGPWIFFALMLAGPVALLLTIVVAMLAAGLLIAAIAALPFLLVRYLRSVRARHATAPAVAQPLPAHLPALVHSRS